MTLVRLDDRRRALAEAMDAQGAWPADSAWVRRAVLDTVPRHTFAPDRLWTWDGHAYVPVDRAQDPNAWADLVYADPGDSAITQIVDGLPSSSLSCVSVVVDMLDSLLLEPGDRVLEVGTGLGWNAGLLTARAGPGRVTSIEVDGELAAAAQRRLTEAGFAVAVHTGDGNAGRPQAAPYDRLIATYAVDDVPWAWAEQTRPGGRLVIPWGRLGTIALTVADDRKSATGWVQGLATFMPSRGTDQGREYHAIRSGAATDRQVRVDRDLGAPSPTRTCSSPSGSPTRTSASSPRATARGSPYDCTTASAHGPPLSPTATAPPMLPRAAPAASWRRSKPAAGTGRSAAHRRCGTSE
ncbi:methyltransferase domain-containing protein [Streptomyces sp. NPDC048383]|uniref:methyltransferase domain-containing protein n=1 Tax=Streptomyces sp. NPDC048383 TaxID=3155386 RepID=UPI00341F70AC